MHLGLGNTLVNNGLSNPDLLSLDLNFAADKSFSKPSTLTDVQTAITARRGPNPVFSRLSSATMVGSDGLIQYAPENLALQSENFGTTWVNNTGNALILNDALSPTGTLTADRIDFPATAAAGLLKQIQQSFSGLVNGNGPVTASVWLRTVSGTSTVYLTLLDGGPAWQRVHVPCPVTTEWQRFSVTLNTPLISLYMAIGPDTRTTNGTPVQPAVQNAASVYAWGAQLERSSTARQYIPTTTSVVYGPRFDHDTSYVGSSVYVTSVDAVGDGGSPLPSERVYFAGIDGNGYPEFASGIYYISFSDGQWILNGDGGNFQAYSADALSDEYFTYIGTGSVVVVLTLACKGLLIEETRDNFIINSNLYSSASATNITATTISGINPLNGFTQIRELSLTGTGASTSLQYNVAAAGTTNKTLSVFIKKPTSGAAPYFTIGFASAPTLYAGIQLTMSGATPVISVTSTPAGGFAVVSSSIQAFVNDWYRVSVVASGVPSNCFPTLYPSNAVWNGTSDIRQTLTASGSNIIHVFGAQLEAGSFATSYIPTTTTALQRSADLCSITGGAFSGFWNASEGSLFSQTQKISTNTNSFIVHASGNSFANGMDLRYNTVSQGATVMNVSGSSQLVTMTTNITSGSVIKQVLGYKVNDCAYSGNGASPVSDTTASIPTVSQMNIGTAFDNTLPINGHIAAIRYFKKRLPNAKLQTITV